MNPYEILGVSENATDEEIKAAYKELVKKYHPDKYTDNPLSDLAAEKIKEINVAYDTICKQRKNGTGGNYDNFDANNSYSYSSFSDIYVAIRSGNLNLAEGKLQNVPQNERTAEWYYLYGEVCRLRGFYDQARQYYQTACDMEPENTAFRQALNNVYSNYNYYTGNPQGNTNTGTGSACSICDICQTIWCADCCCECMGGDLCRCC